MEPSQSFFRGNTEYYQVQPESGWAQNGITHLTMLLERFPEYEFQVSRPHIPLTKFLAERTLLRARNGHRLLQLTGKCQYSIRSSDPVEATTARQIQELRSIQGRTQGTSRC
jgi:hypothetical protein